MTTTTARKSSKLHLYNDERGRPPPPQSPTIIHKMSPNSATGNSKAASPNKEESGSLPSASTEAESAYMEEEAGVEIDELATLIAENNGPAAVSRSFDEQSPQSPKRIQNPPKNDKKKEKKKLSFRLFGKRNKRKSFKDENRRDDVNAAQAPSWDVPTMVEANTSYDAVSDITSIKIGSRKQKSLQPDDDDDNNRMESTCRPPPVIVTPPSLSSRKLIVDVDDDDGGSIVDDAVGIGRKWARFFSRENNGVHAEEDDDDDSSHVDSEAEIDTGVALLPPTTSQGSTEIVGSDGKDEALPPHQDRSIAVDNDETSKQQEGSISLNGEAAVPRHLDPDESPNTSSKRKWRPFSKRETNSAPAPSAVEEQEESDLFLRAVPASDLPPAEAAVLVASCNRNSPDSPAPQAAYADKVCVPPHVLSADEEVISTVSEITSGSDLLKEDESFADGIVAPVNVTISALGASPFSQAKELAADALIVPKEFTETATVRSTTDSAGQDKLDSPVATALRDMQQEKAQESTVNSSIECDAECGVLEQKERPDNASENQSFLSSGSSNLVTTLVGSVSVVESGDIEVSIPIDAAAPTDSAVEPSTGVPEADAAANSESDMTKNIEGFESSDQQHAVKGKGTDASSNELLALSDAPTPATPAGYRGDLANRPSAATAEGENVSSDTDPGQATGSIPPERPGSSGIVARRKTHLASLADNLSIHGKSSFDVSISNTSDDKDPPKSNLKATNDNGSSLVHDSCKDASATKPGPLFTMAADKYAVDEEALEKEMNSFFDQLDDFSLDESVIEQEPNDEVSGLTSAESVSRLQQKPRSAGPSSVEFDKEEEKALVRSAGCVNVNIQQKAESNMAALIDVFDVVAACGRPTDDAQDISSSVALSGDTEDESLNPSKLYDLFDEATSLDDSFWTTLGESTVQTESVQSTPSSMWRLKKLLHERRLNQQISMESSVTGSARSSLKCSESALTPDNDSDFEDSIFDTVQGGEDEEDSIESQDVHGREFQGGSSESRENQRTTPTLEESQAKMSSGASQLAEESAAGQSVSGTLAASVSKTGVVSSSDSKVKTAQETSSSSPTSAKDNDTAAAATTTKLPDKAVEDIQRAMATLKKYAKRHSITEAELLWKIQEEHKKRKMWSASMAEF